MDIRYQKWLATERPIMESELPPGVRYSKPDRPGAEFIAAEYGGRTVVRDVYGMDRHCHGKAIRKGGMPVTILDWPSWCGPRPNTIPPRPALSEAAAMVGTGGRVAVVSVTSAGTIQTFDAYDICHEEHLINGNAVNGFHTVLGFLIAE